MFVSIKRLNTFLPEIFFSKNLVNRFIFYWISFFEATSEVRFYKVRKQKTQNNCFGFWYLYGNIVAYISNAFLGLLSINNSTGFSSASLTATKNPTDSRPSIILWSYDKATYIIG